MRIQLLAKVLLTIFLFYLSQANAANLSPITINSGQTTTVTVNAGDSISAPSANAITNNGTATIINSGTIGDGTGTGIDNSGTITDITNNSTGVIAGSGQAIMNNSSSSINTLTNNGTITGGIGINVAASSTIDTITNSGTITGSSWSAIYIAGGGVVNTLNNYGTLNGGISNSGSIGTLNNAQSGLNYVNFFANMPSRYNVIINSTTSYGTVNFNSINGSTIFGVSSLSTLAAFNYQGVLTGIGAGSLTGLRPNNTLSGTSGQYNWLLQLATGQTDIWDLLVSLAVTGPNAANTLQSVQGNTGGLGNVINQQAATLQAGLQYDCTKYDENNLCISVGGRYTYAGSGPSGNAESGLVILGYQPSAHWRLGGFLDQSISAATPNNIKVGYNGPAWGLFNNWYMNKDRLGLNVQGSIAFANNKVTTTRAQLTDTEAGSGTTQLNGQGYQLQANYVQPVTDNIKAIPYLGLRYTRINNGAYTENASAQVTSPLSYNAMAQNTFAALAGVGASAHLVEKLKGTASVGLQQNLQYSMGNYAGTSSIAGLETFSTQMPGSRNTMATASAGLYYDVRKNERIGMNVLWQQQPFINTNTATAIVSYTLGL